MKRQMTFLAGLACGALLTGVAGCALVPDSVKLPAGQALLVAEAGADGVNRSATIAAPALSPAQAHAVKAGIDATNEAVSAANSLYSKGDIPGALAQLQTAFSDIATLQQQVKK